MKSKKQLAKELYNSLTGIKENAKGEMVYFPHTKIKEILLKVVKDKELIKEINLLFLPQSNQTVLTSKQHQTNSKETC